MGLRIAYPLLLCFFGLTWLSGYSVCCASRVDERLCRSLSEFCDLFVDDHKLDKVPGTGLLSAKTKHLTADETRGLKHAIGKNSHIVLIPQPSDNPRDP